MYNNWSKSENGAFIATVLIALVAVIVGLTGCGRPGDGSGPADPPGGAGAPGEGGPESAEPTGMIHLNLPPEIFHSNSTYREAGVLAVDTPSAQADAELVEVLVMEEQLTGGSEPLARGDNPTVVTSVSIPAPAEGPIRISVPPGAYRLLVLIGTASGSNSCLLASGYTETAVTVVEDQHAEVSIAATTISHAVNITEGVVAGKPYEITATGDTNSSVLTTDSEGSTNTYRFQAKFNTESSAGVVDDVSFTGSQWNLTYPATAPASADDANWYSAWLLAGPYVTYKDANTGAWIALDGEMSRRWRWLSYTLLSESSQLWDEVSVPVTIETSATGVEVDITWG